MAKAAHSEMKKVGFVFQNFQLVPTLTALGKCNDSSGTPWGFNLQLGSTAKVLIG